MVSTLAKVAGSVLGGIISNKGSSKAADTQAKAAAEGQEQAYKIFQEQKELQEPFRQAGLTAQNKLLELLGLGGNVDSSGYGSAMKDFSMEDFQTDPGYQFRLSEGMKALENSASARGNLLSGNQLKAITRYGQNVASDEYGRSYDRFQINRSNKLRPLQSLTGASQTTANTISNNLSNYGDKSNTAIMDTANARASGYVGRSNAINESIGEVTDTLTDYYTRQE